MSAFVMLSVDLFSLLHNAFELYGQLKKTTMTMGTWLINHELKKKQEEKKKGRKKSFKHVLCKKKHNLQAYEMSTY